MTPEETAMREVQLMMRSRYFKMIHHYFVMRREKLFAEEPTGDFSMAINRGRLLEVTDFLRHPELIAKAQEVMAKAEGESTPTPEADENPWLRGILQGSISGGEDLI